MAKKKGLAARRARSQRKKRRNAAHMVANPPLVSDLKDDILPALASFGATKMAERIVYTQVQKKSERWGRHAGAIAAVVSFGGVWLLAHRVKRLQPYHDAIVIGAGLAAGSSILRNYLPKYGWILADPKPADVRPAPKPNAQEAVSQYLSDVDELEAMAESMADGAIGDSAIAAESRAHATKASQLPAHDYDVDQFDDDLDELISNDDLDLGVAPGWAH